MPGNIAYQTDQLAKYFTTHRVEWSSFYPSERAILEQLPLNRETSVLDVGCGCGGLGLALGQRFGVEAYTGVEINELAALTARAMNARARVLCGDILDISRGALAGQQFDVVVSLSCVDWNLQFEEMIAAAWTHVRPGGFFVSTFRITTEPGCNDLEQSHQFINTDGELHGERAAYVVVNARILAGQLAALAPAEVRASGYWGSPSATAITPYKRLCFAAMALRKPADETAPVRPTLDLPEDVAAQMLAEWQPRFGN